MIKSVRYNDSLLHKENSVNTRYIKSKLLDVVSKYFPDVKTDDFFKTYIGFGDDYRIDISCEYQSDYKQGYGKYWVRLTKDFKEDITWVGYGKEQFNNDLSDIEQTIKSLTTVNSSKQIKSSPNFKEFTADEIFDTFNTEELTDTVFMDREQCKANKCGMDEFTELMWDVAPTWLGIQTPDDVREVCRRAKNPKAKAFLEAFETALENAKFTDKFYDSVTVHKKRNVQSSKQIKSEYSKYAMSYDGKNGIRIVDTFTGKTFDTFHLDAEDYEKDRLLSWLLYQFNHRVNKNEVNKDTRDILMKYGINIDNLALVWDGPESYHINCSRQIKSSTVPRTTKELADWVKEHTNWSVNYDEEKDVFFSGPEDEAHYIENGKVITDGDGWTEDHTVEEFMNIMDEGKINSSIIKSSYEDAFTVRPWDTNQVTGTSDEDLGLSYVVEAYGNEFVNVDDETLNNIRDEVLLRYFDDDAYVRDWNINYPDNQIESIYDIEDPEDLNNEELARYFDYEAYGRDIRLKHNMVWDSEEECWVSAHDVDDSELDNDKYIFMRG